MTCRHEDARLGQDYKDAGADTAQARRARDNAAPRVRATGRRRHAFVLHSPSAAFRHRSRLMDYLGGAVQRGSGGQMHFFNKNHLDKSCYIFPPTEWKETCDPNVQAVQSDDLGNSLHIQCECSLLSCSFWFTMTPPGVDPAGAASLSPSCRSVQAPETRVQVESTVILFTIKI